jgi:hypothetical protein
MIDAFISQKLIELDLSKKDIQTAICFIEDKKCTLKNSNDFYKPEYMKSLETCLKALYFLEEFANKKQLAANNVFLHVIFLIDYKKFKKLQEQYNYSDEYILNYLNVDDFINVGNSFLKDLKKEKILSINDDIALLISLLFNFDLFNPEDKLKDLIKIEFMKPFEQDVFEDLKKTMMYRKLQLKQLQNNK